MRGETLTGADPLFAPLLTSSPSVWKPSVGRFPSGRAALSPTCWQSTDRDTLSWLTDRWSCHTEQRESSHPLSQTLSTRCYVCSCSYSFYICVFILGSFASCFSLWTRLYQPQWGRPRPIADSHWRQRGSLAASPFPSFSSVCTSHTPPTAELQPRRLTG